jgi:exosortase A
LVATLFLFRETATAIVSIWIRSDTFAHGFLVPPIVAWLIWRQRHTLAAMAPRPSPWILLLLLGAGLAWLMGDLVAVNAATQLAFVTLLVLLVPAVLGTAVARAIAFPLVFMYFAVPFGEFAMPQLMVWTADFTVFALRLSGIPVLREGLQFVIPSGSWSVIEACSGVRYLIASLTVGTLFAYLNYQSTTRRVIFIIVSILVPIVANWMRAYFIVLLGHLSGNTLAVGIDHIIYGWVFFGVVIMLMFMIGARWSEPEPPSGLAQTAPDSGRATPAKKLALSRVAYAGFSAVVVLLISMPLLARWAINASSLVTPVHLTLAPTLAPDWALSPTPVASFEPAFQNPSASVNATYQNASNRVGLYIGYYRQQDYSRKLVSSENVLVPSKDPLWAQVSADTRRVVWGGDTQQVRSAELRGSAAPGRQSEQRLLVWRIYWVNGKWTASDMLAKVYGALYRLMGRGDDGAAIIVYADKGQAGEGEATLVSFVQANASTIERLLEQTRAQR